MVWYIEAVRHLIVFDFLHKRSNMFFLLTDKKKGKKRRRYDMVLINHVKCSQY